MKRFIDLRSDTFTQPTDHMRQAMMQAVVGDDVFKEDPTVNELEEMASRRFKKEAALFVATGTMANVTAISTLCNHGDQAVVHDRSHIYNLEVGAITSLCGVQPRAIPAPNGTYDLAQLEGEIHRSEIQKAPTTLICLENTFDLNRGLALSRQKMKDVAQVAKKHGIATYLDGARIFNASIALNTPVDELCRDVDAMSFCLSKGLACPVGSVMLGSRDFIQKARRFRQRLGGGWRQAGILAAAGIVALNEMVDRLADDHANAMELGKNLFELGLGVDLDQVQTNIVYVDLESWGYTAKAFCSALEKKNIKVKEIGLHQVRMVTNKDVTKADVELVLDAVKQIKK